MYGCEIVNRLLANRGIETVFQYMAEDTMELMADMETTWSDEIEVIHSRHEQGAMAMADAYARAGDRIGVCMVGRGPAIAQTGTGLINARKNGTPLLVIVPTPAQDDLHDPKEFEQEMFLRSTVGKVVTVESEQTLEPKLREALRRVHLGDAPLAVQIPRNLLNNDLDISSERSNTRSDTAGKTDHASFRIGARSEPGARVEPDPAKIEDAAERYLDSDAFKPPVILVGEGAANAGAKAAIEDVAERLNAIIVTTLKGRDYFDDHPFSTGFSGNWGDPLSNELLGEANYILAVGCTLNNHTVDEGYLVDDDATVIHIDTDPLSIGRYTEVDVGIVGDARVTVEALDEEFERLEVDRGDDLWTDSLRERIAEFSALDGPEFPEKDGQMDPRDLTRTLDDVLPMDRLLGTDGGHFRKWVLDGITGSPENSILSCDFAAIGLGLPMGVGLGQFIKCRERSKEDGRTAVTVCGDGGFMMSLQELETAVRHEIPLVVIVMNDSSLGAEYHNLLGMGAQANIARLETPDIAAVGSALGAESHQATSLEEVEDLEEEMHRPDGPVIVECIVDHEVQHRSYG